MEEGVNTEPTEPAHTNQQLPPIVIPTDVPNRRPGDIVAITPANEKDWKLIKERPRTQWGYTYLAPLTTKQDADALIIDEATTWDRTTKQWATSAKVVDLNAKIAKMDDGQYEIRYYQCSGTWQWRRTLKAISIIKGVPHMFQD
mmetsp:Transcript_47436/g.78718  ORF Transcript_47436/g.78718 Transcript_47436/m.78718 type:complete len:144 (+) Transcript_47436:2-433(+)